LVTGLFCFWLHDWKFSERLHSSIAAGLERRVSAFALSALQIFHPVVFEHSAGDVAVAARQMPELRRADFGPVFSGGIIDRGDVSRLLEFIWAAIAGIGAGLLFVPIGVDGGDVY
jgi:hypothetical protein